MTCETCEIERMSFTWTDTHGIGQCFNCGTPYRVYHYGENGNPLQKEPESVVDEKYKAALREYWTVFHRVIPSGHSFPGGQELASPEDARDFYTWLRCNGPAKEPNVTP